MCAIRWRQHGLTASAEVKPASNSGVDPSTLVPRIDVTANSTVAVICNVGRIRMSSEGKGHGYWLEGVVDTMLFISFAQVTADRAF